MTLRRSSREPRSIHRCSFAFACFALFLGATWSAAVAGQSELAGDERLLDSDMPRAEIGDDATFTLPDLPEPGDETPLSSRPLLHVRGFRIVGNTVLPEAELQKAAAPYVDRTVSSQELQELRRALTRLYVDAGYINSGVVIPDQTISEGVVELRVIEGRLSRIELGKIGRFRPAYIVKRIESSKDETRPLNVTELQNRLQLLNQDPLITEVGGELAPGDQLGESVLKLDVKEREPPYRVTVGVDNRRNPAVGATQGFIYGSYSNFTGYGDVAALGFKKTEGLKDFDVNYFIPVTPQDTGLFLQYRHLKSEVIESSLEAADIESKFNSYTIRLDHPFIKTLTRTLRLGVSFEHRKNKSYLLGRGFPFAPGVDSDGKSAVTPLRLVVDYLDRQPNRVIAARNTFSRGLDALGATVNGGDVPDGQYFAWLGQFQVAQRFENDFQLLLRADAQLADDKLLPIEKFGVGGALSVRGYRENQLVRDNGAVASAELRMPLRFESEHSWLSGWQVATFFDWGRSWNEGSDELGKTTISGAGAGLRWDPTRKIHAEIYWAHPFKNLDTEGQDNDLQDDGITFYLSYDFF